MSKARRVFVPWLWLSVGLLRALLGVAVPAAEARQAAASVASTNASPHIEEESRPECAPPHHDDCALCAYLGLGMEAPQASVLAEAGARAQAFPGRAVTAGGRGSLTLPRPRAPPVVS